MGVILDSCIWVGVSAGHLKQQDIVAVTGSELVYTSVVSLGELAFGVEACADPAERAQRAAFLRQVERRPVLQVTRQTASAFGVLAAAVKKVGRSPRPRYNDLWIAAQAIENGYALLTLNSKNFEKLPALRVITPRKASKR